MDQPSSCADPTLASTGPCAGGVTRLTLDRPDRANAINADLADALLAAFDKANQDGTRVLVLNANGRSFSGGFDFGGYETASQGDLLLRFVRIEQSLQQLWTAPFISIAIVDGAAFGAGADLVAACTYRVGTVRCRFRFPGYRFGVALGTSRLAAVVGLQAARDILLANKVLDSAAAKACGLLTHLTCHEPPDVIVDSLIDQVSDLQPPALAALLATSRGTQDNGATDLADLVASLVRPGLHARIRQYRADAGH